MEKILYHSLFLCEAAALTTVQLGVSRIVQDSRLRKRYLTLKGAQVNYRSAEDRAASSEAWVHQTEPSKDELCLEGHDTCG
jgi:hypothetical protein